MCSIVESTPVINDLPYSKRISWIDQNRFLPLKIEYFDRRGNLWKVLQVEWFNPFGLWFWKKGVVDKVQSHHTTVITTLEVRATWGYKKKNLPHRV